MFKMLDQLVANTWNRLRRLFKRPLTGGLWLGDRVEEGRITSKRYFVPQQKRAEHIAVLGKTGSGKSFLLRHICLEDLKAGRGFVYFDFHGDAVPYLLSALSRQEAIGRVDLGQKLVVIEPGSPIWSVGLNPLATDGSQGRFVQIAIVAGALKERLGLAHFGPQTEEVMRNSLYVLSECGLTVLELSAILVDRAFRSQCLKEVTNREVIDYFESRFDPMSEPMKAAVRNPVLNKFSEFVADPHFRHIVGQSQSTFSVAEVMDEGRVVLVDVNKGLLGKHATTLASLVLTEIRSAIFKRKRREVYTVYCDEIQNLLTSESDIDVLLSEARKFGVSIVSANQYLEQFPKSMRSAIQAVGTHVSFQLSAEDAQQIAAMLDGGKALAEQLKNLPKRRFIAKSGHYPWSQVQVPEVPKIKANYQELLERSRSHYARKRVDIEAEIAARRPAQSVKETLNDWS